MMATLWSRIKHKFSDDRHDEMKRDALAELESMGFRKLRLARQQTQVDLAERLDIPQAAVSRTERRTELLLSMVRNYVEAPGGRLELRAVFPDVECLLDSPAPPRTKRSQSPQARER